MLATGRQLQGVEVGERYAQVLCLSAWSALFSVIASSETLTCPPW